MAKRILDCLQWKLDAVRKKRTPKYFHSDYGKNAKIVLRVKGQGWCAKMHCGRPMYKIEILVDDGKCPDHQNLHVGPVDEYVCACPKCDYMVTDRYMSY